MMNFEIKNRALICYATVICSALLFFQQVRNVDQKQAIDMYIIRFDENINKAMHEQNTTYV